MTIDSESMEWCRDKECPQKYYHRKANHFFSKKEKEEEEKDE